jgi:hypothetical protein
VALGSAPPDLRGRRGRRRRGGSCARPAARRPPAEAIDRAGPLLGPFAFARDLQFSLLAHLDDLVARGEAERVTHDDVTAWAWTGTGG